MVFKASSIPKLPNIHLYSENVKKRDLFKLDKDLLKLNAKNNASKILEMSSYLQNNDSEDAELVDYPNDFTLNMLDVSLKSKEISQRPPKKSKKYLELLNEIETKALEDYEKIKESRSKSTSIVQKFKENPRGFRLRDIKEETPEELEDIDKLLSKKSDFNEDRTFLYYDMSNIQRVLREKIQNELLVPIMDRSKIRNKEKIREEKLKKNEVNFLKVNNRLGKEVEEILGRKRLHYVKKLEEFYKKEKISVS